MPNGPASSLAKRGHLEVSIGMRRVGTLARSREGSIMFAYDAAWLASGWSISPFSLPLRDGLFEATPDMPDGLFGVFRDSLPDDWGRLLQDRKLAGMGIRQAALSSLAPAYDLTQDEGFLGEHATLVNGKGSEVRERDLLAVGSAGGLSARRARAVIRQVEEVVGETLG